MAITDFIRARLAEEKELVSSLYTRNQTTTSAFHNQLRIYDALEKIVDWHKNWPVLVETMPNFEIDYSKPVNDQIRYQVTSQINWMTQKSYVDHFGSQPPTAPVLAMIASIWSTHMDYDPSWG